MSRYLFVSTVLCMLLCPTPPASAIDRRWDGEGGSNVWVSGTNWNPDGVPEFNDDVILGGFTADDTVLLTGFGGQLMATVRNLTIAGGMDLNTSGNVLGVRRDTAVGTSVVTGETLSELIIPSAGDGVVALDTNTLTIGGAGRLRMSGSIISVDGTGDVDGVLEIREGGSIYGYGVINLDDDNISDFTDMLLNDGTITVVDPDAIVLGEPPARTLQINAPNDPGGDIDLDGDNDDGEVIIGRNATLDVNVRPQNFRGVLRMYGNSTLELSDFFAMNAAAEDTAWVEVDSGATDGIVTLPAVPAVITGDTFVAGLRSSISLNQSDEVLIFESEFRSGSPGGGGTSFGGTISNAGTIHFAGDAQIFAETTFNTSGTGRLVNDPGSTLTLRDGVDADTPITNSGDLQIRGALSGEARVDAFTQSETGTLHIQIGDILPGGFDVLTVEGNALLGGTLEVSLINDFEPILGNSFTILRTVFGNISGQFDIENVPEFNDLTFDVIYDDQSVVLQVVEAGLPGDYNDDGTIDAADYVTWRDNLGAPAGTLPNDVDGGTIGQAQYDTWQAQFGATLGSGADHAAVPEPATAILLLLVAGWVLRRRS